jgi:uncharacterized protein
MDIWAIADLHLSFGVPEKTMEIFGPQWVNYAEKMKERWCEVVQPEDLVLIAGDISWALALEHARKDLEWIESLPGVKVLIKGNHDYWWSSLSKVNKILPPSLHLIQNDAFHYRDVSIGGARLWDSDEYNFNAFITFRERSAPATEEKRPERQKIFRRELERLELSLKNLKKEAALRIAMTHYPPIGPSLAPSQAAALLEKYGVEICVFGHLHNVERGALPFGKERGISYHLTSCDYLDFTPLKIYSSAK